MEYEVRHLGLRRQAEDVMREIYLDVATRGLSVREIEEWSKFSCWFPHLRDDATILNLAAYLPDDLRTGTPCEPQIIWALPETYNGELWPHIDQEPPWANGRKYSRIVGVALTPWTAENGAPRMYCVDPETMVRSHIEVPTLDVGDVLVMAPKLPHTRGINRSGHLRAGVYFRYLHP